jgi:CSLREA domain-containing protein
MNTLKYSSFFFIIFFIIFFWSSFSWAELLMDEAITVNSSADNTIEDEACTLREAIENAQGASHLDCLAGKTGLDEIHFNLTTPATINLTAALPVLNEDVHFINETDNHITVRRDTGGNYRIFTINTDVRVRIERLIITNGLAEKGGGIFNAGDLRLVETIIHENRTIASDGGGIYNKNNLEIIYSTISDNLAEKEGGGIYNHPPGNITIKDSTLSGNQAKEEGGAISSDDKANQITVINSTLSGNIANNAGGGIYNCGGKVDITNSTIIKNTALAFVSIGGGVIDNTLESKCSDSVVRLNNTLVMGNQALLKPDVFATLTNSQNNLIGLPTDVSLEQVLNPTLALNGASSGSPLSHALVCGSPAIDAGNNSLAPSDSSTDQRGTSRIIDTIDIGAFEFKPDPTSPVYDFSAESYLLSEKNTPFTTEIVTLIRSENLTLETTVNVLLGAETATADEDFTAGPIKVTFPACESTHKVPIEVIGDTVLEEDETISLSLTDLSHNGKIGTTQSTATLIIRNDENHAPVLDNSNPLNLTAISENVDDASNTGDRIADLITVEDADGDPIGIAVIAVDNRQGKWQYLRDGETQFIDFPNEVSESQAVLLEALTQLRFVPNIDYHGTVECRFRAWDQTMGNDGDTQIDTTVSGDITPFSAETMTASITVNPLPAPPAPPPTPVSPPPPPVSSPSPPSQPVTYDLKITLKGEGKVTGTGIYCGTDCEETHVNGTSITLSAQPEKGYAFIKWTGGCAEAFTISNSISCEAIFAPLAPQYVSTPLPNEKLNFGQVELNQSMRRTLTIENLGQADLNLTAYSISGEQADEFDLISPELPVTLAKGAKALPMKLACQPVETGLREAVLELTTNDALNESVRYDLHCIGSAKTVPNYSLIVSAEGAGSVLNRPEGVDCGENCTRYPANTSIQLEAIAEQDWQFTRWGGDCNEEGEITLTADQTCRAIFNPILLDELLTVSTTHGGTVISTPAGIDCGATCEASFPKESLVTLTAQADSGYRFDAWQGECDAQGQVIMSQAKTCGAHFSLISHSLTVNTMGEGRIILNDDKACGKDCTDTFPSGTVINLKPEPDSGWQFTKWQGDCETLPLASEISKAIEITMNRQQDCTAVFEQVGYPLTFHLVGKGSVNINALPECRETCTTVLSKNSAVSLIASPDEGWTFEGWQAGCTDNLIISSPLTCTALFKPIMQRVDIRLTPEAGKVLLKADSAQTIEFKTHDTQFFPYGTDISFSFETNPGWQFFEWQGDCATETHFILKADHSCSAQFKPLLFITVEGKGKVTSEPAGIECDYQCQHPFSQHETINLIAKPFPYSVFDDWQGACKKQKDNKKISDVMLYSGSRDCRAIFLSDRDGDSIADQIEDQSPYDGDGNYDGEQDSEQKNVASWFDDSTGNYVTVEISNHCAIEDIQYHEMTELYGIDDLSKIQLELSEQAQCDETNLTVYYHGDQAAFSAAYEMYGDYAKQYLNPYGWFQHGKLFPQTQIIEGQAVTKASLHLKKEPEYRPPFQKNKVRFVERGFPIHENAGTVEIRVIREGNTQDELCIDYAALDRTAIQGKDYRLSNQNLCWAADEGGEKSFFVEIIDNEIQEKTSKHFMLILNSGLRNDVDTELGKTTITIMNDDLALCEMGTKIVSKTCDAQGKTFNQKDMTIEVGKHIMNAVFTHDVTQQWETVVKNSHFKSDVSLQRGQIISSSFEGEVDNQGTMFDITLHSGSRVSQSRIDDFEPSMTHVKIEENAMIHGGYLAGDIENAGILQDIVFTGERLEGGTLTGIITNIGAGVIKNVHILPTTASSAYIIGGQVAGQITGDPSEPAILQSVKVLPGTELKNVQIDNSVKLPEEVTLENVTLLGKRDIRGGLLKGEIICETEDTPALLENVTLSDDTFIKNVILGDEIKLGKNLTFAGRIQNNAQYPFHDIQFASDTKFSGGTLTGLISSEAESPVLLENLEILDGSHLKNVELGENVRLGNDLTLEGLIINTGKNTFQTLQFASDTEIRGGRLSGTLIGVQNAPAFLKNVLILSGSHLENVKLSESVSLEKQISLKNSEILGQQHLSDIMISGHITLADDVVLENVQLDANTYLKGGQLQGQITGDPNNPAILENVTLLPNTHLENVFIIQNDALPDNVTTGSNVLFCNPASGTAPQGKRIETQACFINHLKTVSGPQNNRARLAYREAKTLSLSVTIVIDPKHVNQSADIVIVAVQDNLTEINHYTRDQDNWLLWESQVNDFPAAQHYEQLPARLEVNIDNGAFNDAILKTLGELSVYVGYRLKEGTLIDNGLAPLNLSLGNATSLELLENTRKGFIQTEPDISSFFSTWLSNHNGKAIQPERFIESENLILNSHFRIDTEHVGQPADIILLVSRVYGNQIEQYSGGQLWEKDLDELPPIKHYAALPEKIDLPIYQGNMLNFPGEYRLYIGYRLNNERLIVFNGHNPIHFSIGEP